ncbi:unnamed protein product [Larinioides sclopetarius]|uniref:Uncharacterized protein n=1 Tax=Larinioides sclopetarius TaxID=280406 RepID=A0AAV2AJF1_9ARAC
MSDYLNIPLISEAIIFNVLCNFKYTTSEKANESSLLLNLDLILSTVDNFADAFSEMFVEIFDKYLHKDLSEKEFLNVIVPRSLVLCQKKTYFNLMLVCGFMSETVNYFIASFSCFHFANLTCKCLSEIIKREFEDLLKLENGWKCLLSYCEKIDRMVTNYSVENPTTNNSSVKSDLIIKKPLINQFENLKIVDSEMNIEDFRLQTNSSDNIENPENLAREAKYKKMIMESTDMIEFMDTSQKISKPFMFNEAESAHWIQCDKPQEVEFLYELITDSSEHLNEILKLIDTCVADIDPNELSLAEFEVLSSDMQEMSAKVAQEKCSENDFCTCPSNLSDGKQLENSSSNISGTGNFQGTTSIALDAQAECPSNKSDEEINPLQCCEMCKGKEEQYMKNWEINFLERYPELKI